MSKKPLEERVILLSNWTTQPFATIDESWKEVVRAWERGENFTAPEGFLPSDQVVFSGTLCAVLNLISHFVCGIEDENGMIQQGTTNKHTRVSFGTHVVFELPS